METRTYRELRFAKSKTFDRVLNNPKALSGFRLDNCWLECQRIVVGSLGACTPDREVGFFSHGWKERIESRVGVVTRGRVDELYERVWGGTSIVSIVCGLQARLDSLREDQGAGFQCNKIQSRECLNCADLVT